MQKTAPKGFTLIELLVVITIMATVAIVAMANYRSFGEAQTLPNTALDLNSKLRAAQTNATTAVQCQLGTMKSWQVKIYKSGGGGFVDLGCNNGSVVIITSSYAWPKNIVVERVYDNGIGGCDNNLAGDEPAYSVTFKFPPLSGTATLDSMAAGSPQNCSGNKFTIQIKDTKTNERKYITVERGGGIYGQ